MIRPTDDAADAPLVLLVLNADGSARSVENVISAAGCSALRAHTGAEGLRMVQEMRPDAIVLGGHLGDMETERFCRALRIDAALGTAAPPPLLLLATVPLSRSRRLEALREGVWDVLRLPMDTEELMLKLRMIARWERRREATGADPQVDAASGFYSLPGILRKLEEGIADSRRSGRPLALLTFSLRAGEPIPAAMARLLPTLVRRADAIGRVGSDAMAIVAPGTGRKGATHLSARVIEAWRAGEARDAGEGPRELLRAGVAVLSPDGEDARDPVANASDFLARAIAELRRVQGVRLPAWES